MIFNLEKNKVEEDKTKDESIFVGPIVNIERITQDNNFNDYSSNSNCDCADCGSD